MTVAFLRLFFWAIIQLLPLILPLIATMVVLGQIAARIEGWSKVDALYWTFVTATTLGYGDMTPQKKGSRFAAFGIVAIGLMLTGILVATVVSTLDVAFNAHLQGDVPASILESLEIKE